MLSAGYLQADQCQLTFLRIFVVLPAIFCRTQTMERRSSLAWGSTAPMCLSFYGSYLYELLADLTAGFNLPTGDFCAHNVVE